MENTCKERHTTLYSTHTTFSVLREEEYSHLKKIVKYKLDYSRIDSQLIQKKRGDNSITLYTIH